MAKNPAEGIQWGALPREEVMNKVGEVYSEPYAQLITGDAFEVLAAMPEESIHVTITSPPY